MAKPLSPDAKTILALCTSGRAEAVSELARLMPEWANSAVDTSSVVAGIDQLPKPQQFQAALRTLAAHCSDGTLGSCDFYAVRAALPDAPNLVEALLALAGLTPRQVSEQLQRQDVTLPAKLSGPWKAHEVGLRAIFGLVDEVVRGTGRFAPGGALHGFQPARPIEMLWGEVVGWAGVARALGQGVTLGALLAQRAVGSAYRQHRDSTSSLVAKAVADTLAARLLAAEIPFARVGSRGVPARLVRTLVSSRGGISFIVPGKSPKYAVAIRVANDPGTAKSAAAQLAHLSTKKVLVACVAVGIGWALRPHAAAAAAMHLGGRLFSDIRIDELLDDIRATLGVEDSR
jgi:hypothetical protein